MNKLIVAIILILSVITCIVAGILGTALPIIIALKIFGLISIKWSSIVTMIVVMVALSIPVLAVKSKADRRNRMFKY